jgi:hypothetical protein
MCKYFLLGSIIINLIFGCYIIGGWDAIKELSEFIGIFVFGIAIVGVILRVIEAPSDKET